MNNLLIILWCFSKPKYKFKNWRNYLTDIITQKRCQPLKSNVWTSKNMQIKNAKILIVIKHTLEENQKWLEHRTSFLQSMSKNSALRNQGEKLSSSKPA